jgi:hypothetical protein
MAEKEELILPDRQVIPTDEYIYSILGEKKILWQNIISYSTDNFKDISGVWNYYNDGKQWLFKLSQKKKTVFWGAMLNDTFRITFYFGDKVEPLLEGSDLPLKIMEDFKTSKRYGKIRPISLKIFSQSDVESVKKLIDIKIKLK